MEDKIFNQTTEILQQTNDGNDLSPCHLKLIELAVNNKLNEKGLTALDDLYNSVQAGYKKPFFHGIENMTQDHEGFIYWRGVKVNHYSFSNYEEEDKAAKELESRCKILEAQGIKPTSITAIWKWND